MLIEDIPPLAVGDFVVYDNWSQSKSEYCKDSGANLRLTLNSVFAHPGWKAKYRLVSSLHNLIS